MIFECVGNKLITNAFIELHCHLREPGFEYKETIETGMKAARAGGYGIICSMPNTKPVCDNPETLRYILNEASKSADVKVLPICAMTSGLNTDNLVDFELLSKLGAAAFSNDGRPVENMETFRRILEEGNRLNLLMISHAENTEFSPYDNRSEYTAVARELEVLEKVGGRLHFAHISTKESIELIRNAKKKGLKVTCETAPHYFSLTKDDIVNNEARFKMNPPLRSREDLEAVIEGLQDGTIDAIATDHAPHSIEEKMKPFEDAPFGIVGFETAFAISYTNLVLKGHLMIEELLEKMIDNPSKILGVEPYGRIEIDLGKEWIIKAEEFKTKAKITPFEGVKVYGKVKPLDNLCVGEGVVGQSNKRSEYV